MHDIDAQLKYMLMGEFEQGWKISEKLEAGGVDNIPLVEGKTKEEMWLRHNFNRGWYLLQQGHYREGSMSLESGRHLNVYGGGVLKTNAPIYNPQEHDLKDKSIILSLEGGYGDEIIHARYCQSLKALGASMVTIACSPELMSVFERIPGCDKVITRAESNHVIHDYWIPGFSAGWICGHDYSTLPSDPYLTARTESAEVWKSIITSDKKKVGIRWAGNPKFEHQQFRRFPVEFMFDLAKYSDVQLYSLQRDNNLEQLHLRNVIDLQHFLISWEDTLAAISNLDLVITSCTSIAHASAALGKETWVIVPILPYHIWANGAPDSTMTPYYKTVKIYRQQEPSSWNKTFKKLYKDFETKFELKKLAHKSHDKVLEKLNLGSGFKKLNGFKNVDISSLCDPDEVVDLEKLPLPWKTDQYAHIVMKDILEHLGDTSKDFINVLKELYRISQNGAVWEVEVPHHMSDNAIIDPTHKRVIPVAMFNLFDKKKAFDNVKRGLSSSWLAFEHDIDIEVCEQKYDINQWVIDKVESKEIEQESIDLMLNTMNNVASSVKILIQVHKPGRITIEELKSLNK